MIDKSELILNKDGSIFHLHLKPDQIADNIILVGDPDRVKLIAEFLENIEYVNQNREFSSTTGTYNKKRITVISTGIGIGNIDIVINELDALVNIDLSKRTKKKTHRSLNIIRIGTTGALQNNIPVNSFIISRKAIGFDGSLNFYSGRFQVCDSLLEDAFIAHCRSIPTIALPYVVSCSEKLFDKFYSDSVQYGITATAPGFYGSQGRVLRLSLAISDFIYQVSSFKFRNQVISNLEMECAPVYGLSKLLGHEALTICLVIANRLRKEANENYYDKMKDLIGFVLNTISQ